MLQILVDSLHDCSLLILDPQGQTITWNSGAQHITGYRPEEIVGQSAAIFFTPEDLAAGALDHEINEARRFGRYECQGWRLRRDGSKFWANVTTTTLQENNTVRGFVKVMRDVTQRREAEQATLDSAAQLQGVINAAVDGILAISDRGAIEWLNPAALRIFGYTANELIGKNINALMPEPYHSGHDQYLTNYRDSGQAKIIGIGREVKGKRKDGSLFPLDLAVSEVRLGNRRMFTGIIRDITQRKEAEQSLVEARDSAEKAREAAEAANKAKDQFLAMVSHELRTPLTPILAAVSYLEGDPDLSTMVQEEVKSIRRNVEHEAQIVDDLLNLTRVSRGKIELHYEVVDAHTLLRILLAQFQDEIDASNLELAIALRAKGRNIWADPKRIQQVLTNLLHNAIKFSQEGGQIGIRTVNPEEGRLRIEISDTGIGIEPEVLSRLFSPFEQGEKTITRRYGGLGLGLAISKGIVDLHGGALTASSEGKEKGATFTVELTTVPTLPEESPPSAAHETPPIHASHVLLVEDHQDTLRIMCKLLKALGYGVTSATSVQEAVRLADEHHFDILVSDIGLPDGSGLDIVRKILAKQAIKAIAVSGFGQPEDLTRSREAGFIEHLVKPVNFQRLETVLKQITNN